MDMTAHREQFERFAAPYVEGPGNGPVRLKVEHSIRVYEHVRTLVDTEPPTSPVHADPEIGRAALLAGLYHDCGRFPQFRQYHTFQDATSVNHARLGLDVMREQAFLADESRRVRHLAQAAVLLHNRYALPERLTPEARLITDMVRDADKLDILRIMVRHLDGALPDKDTVLLSVRDEAGQWTPKVLQDVMEGRVARYTDLRYVNDFRLLLGTWMHELRFVATRNALRDSGLMDAVLAGLPDDSGVYPDVHAAVLYLRSLLERR